MEDTYRRMRHTNEAQKDQNRHDQPSRQSCVRALTCLSVLAVK